MRGFGIIGGGAVLFTASALAGQTVLPLLGESETAMRHEKQLPNIGLNIWNIPLARLAGFLDDLTYSEISRHFSLWGKSIGVKGNVHGSLLQVMRILFNDYWLGVWSTRWNVLKCQWSPIIITRSRSRHQLMTRTNLSKILLETLSSRESSTLPPDSAAYRGTICIWYQCMNV